MTDASALALIAEQSGIIGWQMAAEQGWDMADHVTVPTPVTAPKRSNLMPPWPKGRSGNPSGTSGLYGEVLRIARDASPTAIRRLIELMASDDERVAAVAANSILDRAWGKPRERPPAENGDGLSRMSDGEIMTELQRIRTLRALAAGGANEIRDDKIEA